MTDNKPDQNKGYQSPFEAQLERVLTPFQEFISDQRTGSMLLLVCTVTALLVANSPLAHSYERLVEMPVGMVFGEWTMTMSVRRYSPGDREWHQFMGVFCLPWGGTVQQSADAVRGREYRPSDQGPSTVCL